MAEQYFRTAAQLLAASDGSLRERLLHAYLFQGVRAYPPDTSGAQVVDGVLAERMRELHYALTATDEDMDHCSIEVSLDAMSDDEAEDLATELVGIARELSYQLGEADCASGDIPAPPIPGMRGSTYIRYPRAV